MCRPFLSSAKSSRTGGTLWVQHHFVSNQNGYVKREFCCDVLLLADGCCIRSENEEQRANHLYNGGNHRNLTALAKKISSLLKSVEARRKPFLSVLEEKVKSLWIRSQDPGRRQ